LIGKGQANLPKVLICARELKPDVESSSLRCVKGLLVSSLTAAPAGGTKAAV